MFPGLAVDLVYAWTGGGNSTFMAFFDVEIVKNHQYVEDTVKNQDHIAATRGMEVLRVCCRRKRHFQ